MAQGLEAQNLLLQEGVRVFHKEDSIHLEISSNKNPRDRIQICRDVLLEDIMAHRLISHLSWNHSSHGSLGWTDVLLTLMGALAAAILSHPSF